MSIHPVATGQRTHRRKGRRAPTIQEALTDALQAATANELPRNQHRRTRNGDGSPLTAWMAGAQKGSHSKIFSVCSGLARFPYKYPGHAVTEVAKRIAQRYDITWLQFDYLHLHLSGLYRCKDREAQYWAGLFNDDRMRYEMRAPATDKALRDACEAIGTRPSNLPLRALLSPHVTHLLLLLQLDEAISQKCRSHF